MQEMLKEEYADFEESLHQKAQTSIRVNPKKPSNDYDLQHKIPWSKNGYYLSARPNFTLDPFFHAGHYYVQEASSMILETVIEKLNLPKLITCLDMCGAPGGKSTLLAGCIGVEAIVHSHEFIPKRAGILKQNMIRWGYPNCIVSAGSLIPIERSGIQYDLILLDAPCSGEGMFRKEPDALKQWNESKVKHCKSMQWDLIQKAYSLCKPGGYILYSTCTFNKQENEELISNSLPEDFKSIPLAFDPDIPLHVDSEAKIKTYRCFPHRMNGEGFTFTVIQKQESKKDGIANSDAHEKSILKSAIAIEYIEDAEQYHEIEFKGSTHLLPSSLTLIFNNLLRSGLHILHAGIPLGLYKGKDWFPDHGLSQSIALKKSVAFKNFEKNEAIDYLRANNNLGETDCTTQWQIARYKEAHLGWIKKTPDRLKNYLPKELRIISF
jgi:16S rRNA C967 or C1407 C5-methylase (RsmB/RsmF family)/NOL1/NOP2/fmu family ribosome biogenesis protein